MAAFAENTELESRPGIAWNYHDGNSIILSHLIRDAAGGHAADVLRFARTELFDPFGMRNVTLEFDAAGTPEGASQILAPARDWARFGTLYLDDGVDRRQAHPARRVGELLRRADTGRMGGIWRRVLDQSRRQQGRKIPHRSRLAGEVVLCQRHLRAICHRRSIRADGHRAFRHLGKSIRHRGRFTAGRRRDRRHRQGSRRRWKLNRAYCRPRCVAVSTRSNRSSDRIASAN